VRDKREIFLVDGFSCICFFALFLFAQLSVSDELDFLVLGLCKAGWILSYSFQIWRAPLEQCRSTTLPSRKSTTPFNLLGLLMTRTGQSGFDSFL
jgi:hypothetical protein